MTDTQLNPGSNGFENFPDILQYLPNDQTKKLLETHANNIEYLNKKGAYGGYTRHCTGVALRMSMSLFDSL